MHKTTAKKFSLRPREVFRKASKGHKVLITHDRYEDHDFVLTAIPKNSNGNGIANTEVKTEK